MSTDEELAQILSLSLLTAKQDEEKRQRKAMGGRIKVEAKRERDETPQFKNDEEKSRWNREQDLMAAVQASIADAQDDDDSWNCPYCTYENKFQRENCIMCRSQRPSNEVVELSQQQIAMSAPISGSQQQQQPQEQKKKTKRRKLALPALCGTAQVTLVSARDLPNKALVGNNTVCVEARFFELMPVGTLTVEFIEGEGLRNTQTFGSQDPYVKIDELSLRTQTDNDGGRAPTWEQEFKVTLKGDLSERILFLECKNKNLLSDATIGVRRLQLKEFVYRAGTSRFAVTLYTNWDHKKPAGTIYLKTGFQASGAAKLRCVSTQRTAAKTSRTPKWNKTLAAPLSTEGYVHLTLINTRLIGEVPISSTVATPVTQLVIRSGGSEAKSSWYPLFSDDSGKTQQGKDATGLERAGEVNISALFVTSEDKDGVDPVEA